MGEGGSWGERWESGRASGPPIIHSNIFPIKTSVQNLYHTRGPQPTSAGDTGIVHFTPKTRCHPPKLETISPPREGDSQTRGGKDEETVRVTQTYSYLKSHRVRSECRIISFENSPDTPRDEDLVPSSEYPPKPDGRIVAAGWSLQRLWAGP